MREEQEQSASANEMAQRKSFKAVLPLSLHTTWTQRGQVEAAATMVISEMSSLFLLHVQTAGLYLHIAELTEKASKAQS